MLSGPFSFVGVPGQGPAGGRQLMIRFGRISSPAVRSAGALVFGAALAAAACTRPQPSLAGAWQGTVVVNKVDVPFRFEIAGDDAELKGAFFDGDLKVASTSGHRQGDRVELVFAQYGSTLRATLADGQLEGQYDRGTRGAAYPFRATRAQPAAVPAATPPDIAGEWRIPFDSSKGEKSWRFVVEQAGNEVTASILRIDGDTGALTGSFRDGTFVLSHFSGARPLLLEITPAADGSLRMVQNRQTNMTAFRPDDARAQAVAEPTDPMAHTRARDPDARFTFRFPDIDGRVVTEADFDGKVLMVSMTGSWCPNCHDEAPFLTELYATYRAQGLEIIAFAFEEEDQLKNPVRLRAFMKNFGISYPVLIVGRPEQLAEKVPQAENLNAFPTTLFVGRDGRIRAIHAGFASRATGDFFAKGKEEMTAIVKQLLAEQPTRTN